MVTRSRMTHRADTEREADSGQRNPFNQPITTTEPVLAQSPCYWQSTTETFRADGDRLVAIAQHLMLFPLSADVRVLDRVTTVTDRRGRVLKGNKLLIQAAVRREDHQEVVAEEYS